MSNTTKRSILRWIHIYLRHPDTRLYLQSVSATSELRARCSICRPASHSPFGLLDVDIVGTEEIHSGATWRAPDSTRYRCASSARTGGGVYAAEHIAFSFFSCHQSVSPLLLCWGCLCHRRRSSESQAEASQSRMSYNSKPLSRSPVIEPMRPNELRIRVRRRSR
jgi:hypothetical protein